jgi:uncharacterized protein
LVRKKNETLRLNADEPDKQALIEQPTSTKLEAYIGLHKILVIDQAKPIVNIGFKLKIITDSLKHLQIITIGGNTLELANQINKSLTGRIWEINLYSLSFGEMVQHHGLLNEKHFLTHRLL